MKTRRTVLLSLLAVALLVSSCRSRTDTSEGSVILSVSHFDGLPVHLSLSAAAATPGSFQVGTITLRNFPKDPAATTSDLQGIELRSYTITYRRRDTGTRVPPAVTPNVYAVR